MSLVAQLQTALGAQAVLVSEAEVAGYLQDWRGRYGGPAACVVLPSCTQQVAAAVRIAGRLRVPVLAQGGNTSLSGGSVPWPDGAAPMLINLARMRAVRAIDTANDSMVVEAGCVLAAVQQAASERRRLYPVSLGAEGSCQIGGNIATNAGGTGVLRYGNTRENVLGLEVVLPDGQIWDGLYRLRKNNTGLDLKHLFIGSEGTLGVITAACLKLHPLPTAQAVAWMAVPNPAAALDMLALFQRRCGASLSAFEMMNGPQLDYVLEHVPGRRAPLPASYAWHVLVELADSGAEPALTGALQETLQQGLAQGWVLDASLAASGPQRAALWALRHSVSQANKQAGIGLSTDCALPVSAVPEFIERATLAVHRVMPGLPIIIVAHLGDGNVHFIPLIPFAGFGPWSAVADRQATASAASAVRQAVHAVAHALSGSFSAEHGIGQLLTQEMARFKPAVELAMMRGIKGLLDPQQLFNPGRLFPAVATTRTSAGTDVEGTSDE
ncbi:FAD-binding oxidoreductase [Verminephrobacter eiseniae]|uniref:FAD linked oxidase domain protein n=1 Tax=Verminephrobacter eiseniae (strain EF01-2) TaxID=391735 RepID=A1WKF3_VEREI|nr:FAD-binding oxidoreductase [Verminephrobacter eiseniae]ABM58110.1 FAD linked oxidase domain protein [Verminephrobacter eiseniae EF01-2]MCW5283714.1 FAD-binding oxidoreductase [Verminephrobacter eiseniae]MCW5301424.1 FAD-binding oxidoreductase [Verminephrobacter eiseniae]MCW8178438.1 FAD-binding oxidoreductase [Verminephrobacter eiseniae]MCW8190585.1 FAD-binding oxidoreductase [Verminephrobacter eiseniae]